MGPAGDREHDDRADIKKNERRHELFQFRAHDRGSGSKQNEPEYELIKIELSVLREVAGELTERGPFQSARIDRQRF